MIINAIRNRRSIRNFKSDPISKEIILEIIKAAQFAPTAMNNRAIEFLIIQDATIKSKLFDVSEPKQPFLKEAPVVIIPMVNSRKSVLPVPDLSLASENIFLQATEMGLGTVWKNFPPSIAKKVQKICGIPEEYVIINAIPLGYPKEPNSPHSDDEFNVGKVYFNQFGAK